MTVRPTSEPEQILKDRLSKADIGRLLVVQLELAFLAALAIRDAMALACMPFESVGPETSIRVAIAPHCP